MSSFFPNEQRKFTDSSSNVKKESKCVHRLFSIPFHLRNVGSLQNRLGHFVKTKLKRKFRLYINNTQNIKTIKGLQ